MRKIVTKIILVTTIFVTSCSAPTSLYYWGGAKNGASKYEEMAYGLYKKQTPEAMCAMICVFEDMVSNPGGTRQVPPPGICAEYAYYLSMPETADAFANAATKRQQKMFERSDYASFFPQYAKQLLEREITLYPESATFVKPLMEKLLQ